VDDVHFAVLENNGQISVRVRDHNQTRSTMCGRNTDGDAPGGSYALFRMVVSWHSSGMAYRHIANYALNSNLR
jgi:hypothetical protein